MRRTLTSDLRPETIDRIDRGRLEFLRAHRRYCDVVLSRLGGAEAWQLEANGVWQTRIVRRRHATEPTRADLDAAYHESGPELPAPILDHIMRHYAQSLPLKTGPKVSTRSTTDDDRIVAFYVSALRAALDAHEADDSAATRDVKRQAARRTANHFGISPRTVDSLLASRRWLKSLQK